VIEERALVLSVQGNLARVKTQRQSACNACELQSSCGQSLISKMASGHGIEMSVENRLSAQSGDVVLLAIPEEGLMKASVIMFLIPLLAMVVFALVAKSFFVLSDPWVALVGLVGLLVGFLWARIFSRRFQSDESFQPLMSAIALPAKSHGVCQN